MTDREAFEAWYCDQFGRLGAVNGENKLTYYADSHTHVAWTAWQAATAAERERCAKVADSMNTFGLPPDVAAEIRKGPPI